MSTLGNKNDRRAYKALPSSPPPLGSVCRYIPFPDDPDYVALLYGAIGDLARQSRWARDDAHTAKDIAAYWQRYLLTLMGLDNLYPICPTEPPIVDCTEPCTEFMPEQTWITYLPNDPFQTPNFIPEGYEIPPFYHNAPIPITGVLPTDAMVNGASLPIGQFLPEFLSSGFPRIRIPFEGTGQVELEFVKIPQGGYAYVYPDGNPLVGKFIDLNFIALQNLNSVFDLIDITLAGGLSTSIIDEWDFVTTGEHTLDVLFLPNVDENVIVGFGGGLRSIEFCGNINQGVPEMPQFQIAGCELQWKPNSASSWVSLGDVCGEDGQDGSDAPTILTHIALASDCSLRYTWAEVGATLPPHSEWNTAYGVNQLKQCLGIPTAEVPTSSDFPTTPCDVAVGTAPLFLDDLIAWYEYDLTNGPFPTKEALLIELVAVGLTSWVNVRDVFNVGAVINQWTTPTAGGLAALQDANTLGFLQFALYCSMEQDVDGSIAWLPQSFKDRFDTFETGLDAEIDAALNYWANVYPDYRWQQHFVTATLTVTGADCSGFMDCDAVGGGILQIGAWGTNLIHLGDNRYRVTATHQSGAAYRVNFNRIGGGCFTLSDGTVLVPPTQSSGTTTNTLCGGANQFRTYPNTFNVSLQNCNWLFNGAWTIEFTAVPS